MSSEYRSQRCDRCGQSDLSTVARYCSRCGAQLRELKSFETPTEELIEQHRDD